MTELRATAIALETLAGGVTDLTHGRRSRKEQEHISPAPPLPGDVLENVSFDVIPGSRTRLVETRGCEFNGGLALLHMDIGGEL